MQVTTAAGPAVVLMKLRCCSKPSMPLQDLPFPRDQVAAAANVNPDYPGTCGRCYQVRWAAGLKSAAHFAECSRVKACSSICTAEESCEPASLCHHPLLEHSYYIQILTAYNWQPQAMVQSHLSLAFMLPLHADVSQAWWSAMARCPWTSG